MNGLKRRNFVKGSEQEGASDFPVMSISDPHHFFSE
jgi:hypothetical protein